MMNKMEKNFIRDFKTYVKKKKRVIKSINSERIKCETWKFAKKKKKLINSILSNREILTKNRRCNNNNKKKRWMHLRQPVKRGWPVFRGVHVTRTYRVRVEGWTRQPLHMRGVRGHVKWCVLPQLSKMSTLDHG